jgi:hypothetical protein
MGASGTPAPVQGFAEGFLEEESLKLVPNRWVGVCHLQIKELS